MAPFPDKLPDFLSEPELWPQGAGRCLLFAQYDIARYRDSDYAGAGLAPPDFLSRAVPKRRAEFLAGRALGDRVHLGATPDAAGATAVFSAKEALYKALFPRVGRFFGFDHAEIAEIRPDGLALRLTKPLSTGWPAGCVFEIAQHWRAGTVISQCEIAS